MLASQRCRACGGQIHLAREQDGTAQWRCLACGRAASPHIYRALTTETEAGPRTHYTLLDASPPPPLRLGRPDPAHQ